MLLFREGGPQPQDLMPGDLRGADVIILQIKSTINVKLLNHPEITPYPVCGKTVFLGNRSLVPERLGTAALEDSGVTEDRVMNKCAAPLRQLEPSVSFSQLVSGTEEGNTA